MAEVGRELHIRDCQDAHIAIYGRHRSGKVFWLRLYSVSLTFHFISFYGDPTDSFSSRA